MKYNNLQLAHRLVDELSLADQDLLKPFLPELPEQKTISEIISMVYEAYMWEEEKVNSERLDEIHYQLQYWENFPPARETVLYLEDYEGLPEDSVVLARGLGFPWMKRGDGLWHSASAEVRSDEDMAGVPREVVRKGKENVQ